MGAEVYSLMHVGCLLWYLCVTSMVPWPSNDLEIFEMTVSYRIHHAISSPGAIILYKLDLSRHKEHASPIYRYYP